MRRALTFALLAASVAGAPPPHAIRVTVSGSLADHKLGRTATGAAPQFTAQCACGWRGTSGGDSSAALAEGNAHVAVAARGARA